ncbi:porin [Polycladidibacter hongkongensis]|uniref:porin n=1 Tax=Polycladidibacter hongkongensis TaxID=1647556 RepID=UPI000830097F|nr:porin [Pseudovibrio hongkongensis]
MNAKLIAMAAAAAAAATSAQAADLPVAAEPVDYVQACDTFGAGFFKLPGKDTCIKVGGRIRANAVTGNFKKGADGKSQAKEYSFYTKGYLYLTSMTDTEIGLIKTYSEFTATHDQAGASTVGIGNAYIDLGIAGGQLVIGRAGSKFNGFTGYAAVGVVDRKMFDNDVLQVSYTASLGNGISAALSLEDSNKYGGADNKVDFVGALEVSQGWGSAKIAAAAHQNEYKKTGYGVNGKVELDLGQYVAGTKVAFGAAYAKDALAYVDAKNADVTYTAEGWQNFISAKDYADIKLAGKLDATILTAAEQEIAKAAGLALDADGSLDADFAVFDADDEAAAVTVTDENVLLSTALAGALNAKGAKAYALSGGVKFAVTEEVTFAVDGSYMKLDNKGTLAHTGTAIAAADYGYNFEQKAYAVDGSISYAPVAGLVLALDAGWEKKDTTFKYDSVGSIVGGAAVKAARKVKSSADTVKVGARVQYTF